MANPTILIVDDEEDLCGFLETFVEDDFVITTCTDGLKAKDLIEANAYDLILTDLNMPNFNGIQLVTAVKELQPETPVVIVTGYGAEDPAVKEAMEAGAAGMLPKPFEDIDTLIGFLQSFLKNGAAA